MDSRPPASQPYRILLPQDTQPLTTKASIESLDHFTSPTKALPDWVTIYPHVWHMYRVKGFKLREIMTHMEYTYGFKATKQMYKKQFKKWGLTKRARSEATNTGSWIQTEQMRRHHLVSHQRIKPIATMRQAQRRDIPSPMITLEPDVHTQERELQQVLTNVTNWVYGIVEMGGEKRRTYSSSIEMYQTFTLAMELFSLNYGFFAGLAIRKMFVQLEDAIQEFNIDLVWNLVDMIFEMTMAGQKQLLGIFVKHLFSITQKKLEALHPLRRFANLIFRQDIYYLNILRVHNSKVLDRLAEHVSSKLYRQELHDSCIVRLQRQACLVPDQFVTGIWTLKRSHINIEGYAKHWDTILSRRPQPAEALRVDVAEVKSLATELLLQKILWHENEIYSDKIILDAKRRLAWIALNDGGVLSNQTNDEEDNGIEHKTFQKVKATSTLHKLHEILAIERHFRLVCLENEAYQLQEDLVSRVKDFLDDILHGKRPFEE